MDMEPMKSMNMEPMKSMESIKSMTMEAMKFIDMESIKSMCMDSISVSIPMNPMSIQPDRPTYSLVFLNYADDTYRVIPILFTTSSDNVIHTIQTWYTTHFDGYVDIEPTLFTVDSSILSFMNTQQRYPFETKSQWNTTILPQLTTYIQQQKWFQTQWNILPSTPSNESNGFNDSTNAPSLALALAQTYAKESESDSLNPSFSKQRVTDWTQDYLSFRERELIQSLELDPTKRTKVTMIYPSEKDTKDKDKKEKDKTINKNNGSSSFFTSGALSLEPHTLSYTDVDWDSSNLYHSNLYHNFQPGEFLHPTSTSPIYDSFALAVLYSIELQRTVVLRNTTKEESKWLSRPSKELEVWGLQVLILCPYKTLGLSDLDKYITRVFDKKTFYIVKQLQQAYQSFCLFHQSLQDSYDIHRYTYDSFFEDEDQHHDFPTQEQFQINADVSVYTQQCLYGPSWTHYSSLDDKVYHNIERRSIYSNSLLSIENRVFHEWLHEHYEVMVDNPSQHVIYASKLMEHVNQTSQIMSKKQLSFRVTKYLESMGVHRERKSDGWIYIGLRKRLTSSPFLPSWIDYSKQQQQQQTLPSLLKAQMRRVHPEEKTTSNKQSNPSKLSKQSKPTQSPFVRNAHRQQLWTIQQKIRQKQYWINKRKLQQVEKVEKEKQLELDIKPKQSMVVSQLIEPSMDFFGSPTPTSANEGPFPVPAPAPMSTLDHTRIATRDGEIFFVQMIIGGVYYSYARLPNNWYESTPLATTWTYRVSTNRNETTEVSALAPEIIAALDARIASGIGRVAVTPYLGKKVLDPNPTPFYCGAQAIEWLTRLRNVFSPCSVEPLGSC